MIDCLFEGKPKKKKKKPLTFVVVVVIHKIRSFSTPRPTATTQSQDKSIQKIK